MNYKETFLELVQQEVDSYKNKEDEFCEGVSAEIKKKILNIPDFIQKLYLPTFFKEYEINDKTLGELCSRIDNGLKQLGILSDIELQKVNDYIEKSRSRIAKRFLLICLNEITKSKKNFNIKWIQKNHKSLFDGIKKWWEIRHDDGEEWLTFGRDIESKQLKEKFVLPVKEISEEERIEFMQIARKIGLAATAMYLSQNYNQYFQNFDKASKYLRKYIGDAEAPNNDTDFFEIDDKIVNTPGVFDLIFYDTKNKFFKDFFEDYHEARLKLLDFIEKADGKEIKHLLSAVLHYYEDVHNTFPAEKFVKTLTEDCEVELENKKTVKIAPSRYFHFSEKKKVIEIGVPVEGGKSKWFDGKQTKLRLEHFIASQNGNIDEINILVSDLFEKKSVLEISYKDAIELVEYAEDMNVKKGIETIAQFKAAEMFQEFMQNISDEKAHEISIFIQRVRSFPSFEQRMIMYDLKKNHTVLNAIDMGGGKTAGFILSKESVQTINERGGREFVEIKEFMQSKKALVVCPPAVVDVWVERLVGKDGNYPKYFKEGEAPKIFVLETGNDYDKPYRDNLGRETYLEDAEYVIVNYQMMATKITAQLHEMKSGELEKEYGSKEEYMEDIFSRGVSILVGDDQNNVNNKEEILEKYLEEFCEDTNAFLLKYFDDFLHEQSENLKKDIHEVCEVFDTIFKKVEKVKSETKKLELFEKFFQEIGRMHKMLELVEERNYNELSKRYNFDMLGLDEAHNANKNEGEYTKGVYHLAKTLREGRSSRNIMLRDWNVIFRVNAEIQPKKFHVTQVGTEDTLLIEIPNELQDENIDAVWKEVCQEHVLFSTVFADLSPEETEMCTNALQQIKNTYLMLLTGTPIPNKVGDIAALIRLLDPHYFSMSVLEIKRIIKTENIGIIRLILSKYMHRHENKEIMHLPELFINGRPEHEVMNAYFEYALFKDEKALERLQDICAGNFEFTETEKILYQNVIEETSILFSNKIRKLLQLCLDPAYLNIETQELSSKFIAFTEKLDEYFLEENHVVAPFAHCRDGMTTPFKQEFQSAEYLFSLEKKKGIDSVVCKYVKKAKHITIFVPENADSFSKNDLDVLKKSKSWPKTFVFPEGDEEQLLQEFARVPKFKTFHEKLLEQYPPYLEYTIGKVNFCISRNTCVENIVLRKESGKVFIDIPHAQKKITKKDVVELQKNSLWPRSIKKDGDYLKDFIHALNSAKIGVDICIRDGKDDTRSKIFRDAQMRIFQKFDGRKKLLLANERTMSEGIDLSFSSRMILVNPVWQLPNLRQIIARQWRMGQMNPVHVHMLIASGFSIDDEINLGTIEEGDMWHMFGKDFLARLVIDAIALTDEEWERYESVGFEEDDTSELTKHVQTLQQQLNVLYRKMFEKGADGIESYFAKNPDDLAKFVRLYALNFERTYPGNNQRFVCSFLKKMHEKEVVDLPNARILSVGSGPCVLEQGLRKFMKKLDIVNVDLLQPQLDMGRKMLESQNFPTDSLKFQGRMSELTSLVNDSGVQAIVENSIDILECGLAFNDLSKTQGCKERIEVLKQFNAVVKMGGFIDITLPYSSEKASPSADSFHKFCEILLAFGFEVDSNYSGLGYSTDNDESRKFQVYHIWAKKVGKVDDAKIKKSHLALNRPKGRGGKIDKPSIASVPKKTFENVGLDHNTFALVGLDLNANDLVSKNTLDIIANEDREKNEIHKLLESWIETYGRKRGNTFYPPREQDIPLDVLKEHGLILVPSSDIRKSYKDRKKSKRLKDDSEIAKLPRFVFMKRNKRTARGVYIGKAGNTLFRKYYFRKLQDANE